MSDIQTVISWIIGCLVSFYSLPICIPCCSERCHEETQKLNALIGYSKYPQATNKKIHLGQ